MTGDLRRALLAASGGPLSELAGACLLLASEDLPGLDPRPVLARIDQVALELRARLEATGPGGAARTLAATVAERLDVHPAGGGDPRAHYFHTAVVRGRGVPLACGAAWIAVGRSAGLAVDGVIVPGQFILRVDGVFMNCFAGGEVLDGGALRSLLGPGGSAATVVPATVHDVLVRMSRNLRGCYASLGSWELALRAADRCVALLPEAASERRDRGLVLWRMGRDAAALDDLRTYLSGAPGDAADRRGVEAVTGRLRGSLN